MNIIYFLKGVYEGKEISGDVERIISKQDVEIAKIEAQSDEADTSGMSEEESSEEEKNPV